MRNEGEKRIGDLLHLICDLIELPRPRIRASFLESYGGDAERLITMGLLRPTSGPRTIACRACDGDHGATVQFDTVSRQWFHFCPVAGRVEIEPRDLDTLEINSRAIVDLLIAAFPVLPPLGVELVAGKVWHLGEAIVGGTALTLIFACRIGSQWAFGAMARAVAAVPVTEIGMIVTSSPLPDPALMMPIRYRMISLRDIAIVYENRIKINQRRVGAHIKMVPGNQGRFGDAGRPSARELVFDAYQRRRQRREPFVSVAAEARAIVTELAKAHPDRATLGVSTVRRHMGNLRSSRS
jgi:hypothetical protein